jgi:negative regulator of flagellin synthesis FlgM
MPSVELSKLQGIGPVRALSDSDRAQLQSRANAVSTPAATAPARPGVAIEVSTPVETVTPPVDRERVEEIRHALRNGTYPLVPAKIADAEVLYRRVLAQGAPA